MHEEQPPQRVAVRKKDLRRLGSHALKDVRAQHSETLILLWALGITISQMTTRHDTTHYTLTQYIPKRSGSLRCCEHGVEEEGQQTAPQGVGRGRTDDYGREQCSRPRREGGREFGGEHGGAFVGQYE